jgi:hypothetical protein
MLFIGALSKNPNFDPMLSSLQINILPNLVVRLGMGECKSDCGHIEMVKDSLHELLSMTSNGLVCTT